ncbi:sigma-54 interaction domain-containing protein [Methylocucumis oryzae]|uniref:ATPase AAA n=1 Tax=Methylocucumis oryzae TaxID=1632867 RepID=A0A0F3IH59_9GAMM|nr:sigma-54 dependent transcriptional regulator [Methylocucumis oryzae]KJV06115.1 ATPase AAA [Methylocucumis oryzae]
MNHFSSIVGRSPALDALIRSAKIAASTDVTILIKGETGTGKEVLANAIQKSSPRANKKFITLNCAALPEGLIESELFGHKKGAFTGANSNTQGLFKAADGGTIFLDEINSLPLSIQGKLLRFLDSGECLPVGETTSYKVDVRILAATNKDLNDQIATGEFRQDLYFRLNVVPLELPPLSKRAEDIELLIKHFMTMFSETHAIEAPSFSKSALKALKTHPWPGNVRELRNLCERLCILLSGRIIELENLPNEFRNFEAVNINRTPGFTLPEMGIQLDSLEADLIFQALDRTKGNRSKSAKLLGLSRDTLLYRMQKHGFITH